MIKWKSDFGHSIEIEFLKYQFPDIEQGYDANWIEIKVNAKNERGAWSKTSACLFSWDIIQLHYWLNDVVIGESEFECFIVMDMDLEIKYIATSLGKYVFAIVLRPGLSISEADRDIVFVNVSDIELKAAMDYLLQAFSMFPPRGEIGKVNLEIVENSITEQKNSL